jgi:hypothetical protein
MTWRLRGHYLPSDDFGPGIDQIHLEQDAPAAIDQIHLEQGCAGGDDGPPRPDASGLFAKLFRRVEAD